MALLAEALISGSERKIRNDGGTKMIDGVGKVINGEGGTQILDKFPS